MMGAIVKKLSEGAEGIFFRSSVAAILLLFSGLLEAVSKK